MANENVNKQEMIIHLSSDAQEAVCELQIELKNHANKLNQSIAAVQKVQEYLTKETEKFEVILKKKVSIWRLLILLSLLLLVVGIVVSLIFFKNLSEPVIYCLTAICVVLILVGCIIACMNYVQNISISDKDS